jgi:hypothetical protein
VDWDAGWVGAIFALKLVTNPCGGIGLCRAISH